MQIIRPQNGGGGGSGNDKGYFATPTALTTAYPVGQAGWYAIVGTTDTVWIWDADTNAWIDSGVAGSGDVVGPASAVDGNFAAFDTTTGKLIKDSGFSGGDFLQIDQTTPQTVINGIPTFADGIVSGTAGTTNTGITAYGLGEGGSFISEADIAAGYTKGVVASATQLNASGESRGVDATATGGSQSIGVVSAGYGDTYSYSFYGLNGDIYNNGNIKNDLYNTATGSVSYNTGYTKTGLEPTGTRYRDSDWDTTSLVQPDGVVLQDGQEIHRKVYNSSVSTINNGTIVYQNGNFGEYATIGLADASDEAKINVIGILTQNILTTSYGKITVIGLIHGLDTHLYSAGTTLYLSDSNPGEWTSTPPSKAIPVAVVQKSDATDGAVYVNFAQPGSLAALTDTLISSPAAGQILTWNGTERVNGPAATASAGPGVNFYADYTQVIGSGVNNDHIIRTLSKAPSGNAESIVSNTFTGAGTQFACAFLDSALGRTTVDAGARTFNSYVNTTITGVGQTSNYSRTLCKVVSFNTYTLTTTGTGTTRTLTTSGSMFVAGDYNASIELTSYIQTPQGLYPVAGYTSGTVVTITVPSTYTNETGVSGGWIWRQLFNFASPSITTTYPAVTVLTASQVQPAFIINATDKLGTIVFAHATTSCTVRLYMDGTTHASFFNSPLVTFHNDLASIQGGTATERYHLTSAQATVATQAANGTQNGYLSSSDWTTFSSKAPLSNPVFTGTVNTPERAVGVTSTVTTGGTTTLTVASTTYQIFTGTQGETVYLPNAVTLSIGQRYMIDNDSTQALAIKTNGGADVWTVAPGTDFYITLRLNGTAAGTWEFDYLGAKVATGKKLTVNNTITLAGTDGTTMTFPATSSTLVPDSRTLTINGTTYDLSANRTWTIAAGGAYNPVTAQVFN